LAQLLGNKLPAETAAVSAVGLFNSPRTSLFPFASPNFLLLQTNRERDNHVVYRCVSPLQAADSTGWWNSARVAGTGGDGGSSLQVSMGLGLRWVGAGLPFAFQIPSCSHLLWPTLLKPFIFPNF